MIEAKFEYSYQYIKELNSSTMRIYNIIGQIALFLILCGVAVMFAVARNILLGVLSSITFVMLLAGFISANKAVERANRGLIGQQVKVKFDENEMIMTATIAGETLYTSRFDYSAIKSVKEKNDLMFIKFDKKSMIVIPKSGFKKDADFKKVLDRVSNNYVV